MKDHLLFSKNKLERSFMYRYIAKMRENSIKQFISRQKTLYNKMQ